MWKLIGNVHIQNLKGEKIRYGVAVLGIRIKKRVYSDQRVRIEQPDQIIYAIGFESNEQLTKYRFFKTEGIFYVDEDSVTPSDTLKNRQHQNNMMSTIIYLLITMAFSAFFSGMEIAFVSVDKLRFEMERKPGITSKHPFLFSSAIRIILFPPCWWENNIALVIYGILMAQIIEVKSAGGYD